MANGLHYSDTIQGRVFSQSATPLGLAIPIYTATAIAGGMPIWNPPGSFVNVELVEVSLARGSGTATFGAIGLMAGYVQAIATASGLSAMAATNPFNNFFGIGGNTKVSSSNAGTVTVTAGVATAPVNGVTGAGWVRTLFSHNLEADTGTAHAAIPCNYSFNGSFVMGPGTLVYLAATTATTALYATSITWKEIPIQQ